MSADDALRARAKFLLRQVDAILWTSWNPIGCAVPPDEYTSYAGPIARMLIEERPEEEIVAYLCRAYEMIKGEQTDGFGERLIAKRLRALIAPQ